MYLRERMVLGFAAANPILHNRARGPGISIAVVMGILSHSLFVRLIPLIPYGHNCSLG